MILQCRTCGNDYKRKPVLVAAGTTYCSKRCMAVGYSTRLRGASNPNFRNIAPTRCWFCGEHFTCRTRDRKFCTTKCATASRTPIGPRPRELPPLVKINLCRWVKRDRRVKERRPKTCAHCLKEYFSYNKNRQFCSYGCFVGSGGPRRAGAASNIAKMKYGAKKDANHAEIVAALEKCGASVLDLSSIGGGCPDAVVSFRGVLTLLEIKNLKTGYGRRGLNPLQTAWAARWKGSPVRVVTSVDEALAAIGALA